MEYAIDLDEDTTAALDFLDGVEAWQTSTATVSAMNAPASGDRGVSTAWVDSGCSTSLMSLLGINPKPYAGQVKWGGARPSVCTTDGDLVTRPMTNG